MKKIFLILFLSIGASTFAQEKLDLNLGNSCSYYGEEITDEIYGFSSSQEAREIIYNIVEIVGLEPNFEIQAANVPNAVATIRNEIRFILYSQNFITRIKNATGTDWSGISILAHEVGHHLNGHTIQSGGSRPNIELEADKFSGFVCAKLGATLDEAQIAMQNVASNSGSSTHPPKSARLEAIAIGWNKAKTTSKSPEEPNTNKPPTIPNETINRASMKTTIGIVYPGDQWGCNLPMTITIGDKSFTPQGNSVTVSDIPIGQQKYIIQGNINCPYIGNCTAFGEGYINVQPNSTFYVRWQNTGYANCTIALTIR